MTADPFQTQMLAAMPDLRRWALKLTRSSDRADDLVQDTVIKALRSREAFQLGTNMKAWLSVIARNQFLSQARRASRQVDCFDDSVRFLSTPDRPDDRLQIHDLMLAMDCLPPDHREALEAIAIDGLSYEEAALALDTETGTIKSRVSRSRKMLGVYFNVEAA